jgi:hypothetical protein
VAIAQCTSFEGVAGSDSLSETKHLVVSTVGGSDPWMSAVQRNSIRA